MGACICHPCAPQCADKTGDEGPSRQFANRSMSRPNSKSAIHVVVVKKITDYS